MTSRRRARACAGARTAERRIVSVATAVHAGLWLGVLDHHDLHAVDAAHYANAARYLDEEHNRSGLMPWEREAFSGHFPSSGAVLVLAAGAGREMLALLDLGYDVVGYEPHPLLVSTGETLLAGRASLHASARDEAPAAPPGGRPFDAVVVGWSAYTLVIGSARRRALLRQLRTLVRDDAPVLLSFFTRTPDDTRSRLVAGTAGAVRRLRGRPPVELGDDLLPNAVHRFTRAEVAAELAAAGFVLARWQPQGPGPMDSGWAVGTARAAAGAGAASASTRRPGTSAGEDVPGAQA